MFLCMNWIWTMNGASAQPEYSQVRQLFYQEKVESFVVEENTLILQLREEVAGSTTLRHELYDFEYFYNDLNDLVQEQADKGIITSYNYYQDHSTNWLEILLPWILTALLVGVMWYFFMARAQGGMGGDRMSKFGTAL